MAKSRNIAPDDLPQPPAQGKAPTPVIDAPEAPQAPKAPQAPEPVEAANPAAISPGYAILQALRARRAVATSNRIRAALPPGMKRAALRLSNGPSEGSDRHCLNCGYGPLNPDPNYPDVFGCPNCVSRFTAQELATGRVVDDIASVEQAGEWLRQNGHSWDHVGPARQWLRLPP